MIPLGRDDQSDAPPLTQPVGLVPAVRPIRQHVRGAESGTSPTPPLDLAAVEQRLEHQQLVTLASCEEESQGLSLTVTFQVDLRSEAALRAAEGFVAVPFFAPAAL